MSLWILSCPKFNIFQLHFSFPQRGKQFSLPVVSTDLNLTEQKKCQLKHLIILQLHIRRNLFNCVPSWFTNQQHPVSGYVSGHISNDQSAMSSLQNAVYQSIYEQIKDPSKVNEMLPDINPYQMVDHHKKNKIKRSNKHLILMILYSTSSSRFMYYFEN